VKLMAGFGALLGARRLFEASLWTAGIGGLLAVAVLAIRPVWGWVKGRWGSKALADQETVLDPEAKQKNDSIPYAPAITLGVWLSLVPKG